MSNYGTYKTATTYTVSRNKWLTVLFSCVFLAVLNVSLLICLNRKTADFVNYQANTTAELQMVHDSLAVCQGKNIDPVKRKNLLDLSGIRYKLFGKD